MTTAPTGPSGPAGPGPGRDWTGPTQPTPQPLPAPGPPPAPRGHLPIGALAERRLPYLDQVVSDARNDGTRMLATLRRWYDPMSVAVIDPYADPTTPDIYLAKATSHVKSALRELDQLAALGSAATYPGPSDSSACLSGGSASHPVRRPGEGLRPGSAAGARTASARIDRAVVAPVEGANHLAASSLAASGGLLPGLVDATPTAADIDKSVAPDAGESSGPRPGLAEGARPAHDAADPPGVGFTLPVTERFTMPGTERIARSINEALTGQSW